MDQQFDVVIQKDADGYYVASVPRFRGCRTQARSLDEMLVRVREAIAVCLEDGVDDDGPLDFIGVYRVTVSSDDGR